MTIAALRGHLRAPDPAIPASIRRMDERLADLEAGPRFQAWVLGGFAALALVLACTGVYGVSPHVVVLRRREIGVRVAPEALLLTAAAPARRASRQDPVEAPRAE